MILDGHQNLKGQTCLLRTEFTESLHFGCFCADRLMGELMRDVLLSIDDLQRCKTPAVVWKLAKFLLVVSGYIKRKVL